MWQNHFENKGFITSRSIGGLLVKRECRNKHIKYSNTISEVQVELLQLMFIIYKTEYRKVFQKIECSCESVHHDDTRTFISPYRWKPFSQHTPMTGPSTESDPQKSRLFTDNHHWHRQKRKRNHRHTKDQHSKAWVTTLSKIDLTRSNGPLLDMQWLQAGDKLFCLQRLTLNTLSKF
jgi:hypothetical protein